MNAMFAQLRKEPKFMEQQQKEGGAKKLLNFVDLGSGDGRIVFRAAQENLFTLSIGYEINPLLHLFASSQRILLGPQAWSSTRFYLCDLWNVDLRDADVVAVVRSTHSI
jgi:Histone methylation protein DOT1